MEHGSPESSIEQSRLETQVLAKWKRRVYQLALGAGSLILMLSWYMRAPGDIFIAWVYPFFALLFVLVLVLLRIPGTRLSRLEMGMFVGAAALILSRLAWHFFVIGSVGERLLVLTGGHYWSVGILLVAGFVMFDRLRGIRAGSAVLVLSIVIAVIGLTLVPPAAGLRGHAVRHLLRVHLFLIIIFTLSSAGAILREHYSRALLRTELLEEWANVDALTGLGNRRAADRRLTETVSHAVRHERPLAIIMSDIDRFKWINDEHGHTFGDSVLKEIAVRLSRFTRESDFVARWGGEEFLIIAPDTRGAEAAHLAERCRTGVAAEQIMGVQVTMTFGVAEHTPDDTIDSLLIRADANLYEGKETGRNRVVSDSYSA